MLKFMKPSKVKSSRASLVYLLILNRGVALVLFVALTVLLLLCYKNIFERVVESV